MCTDTLVVSVFDKVFDRGLPENILPLDDEVPNDLGKRRPVATLRHQTVRVVLNVL